MKNMHLVNHIPKEHKHEFILMHNTIAELTEQNNTLKRTLFGKKSERKETIVIDFQETLWDHAEIEIIEGEPNAEKEKKSSDSKNSHPEKSNLPSGGRKAFPEHLERNIIVVDVPESEKICKTDGATLVQISEKIVEKLDFVPGKIVVNRYITLI
jgi:transposase